MKQDEGNKLIAEFMGFKEKLDFQKPKTDEGGFFPMDKKGNYDTNEYFIPYSHIQYHTSWDWLMPACKKWDDLQFNVESTEMKYVSLCDEIDNIVASYEILPTWEQLVKNITWYNSLHP